MTIVLAGKSFHECVISFELANDTVNKQKELTLIRKLNLSLSVSV